MTRNYAITQLNAVCTQLYATAPSVARRDSSFKIVIWYLTSLRSLRVGGSAQSRYDSSTFPGTASQYCDQTVNNRRFSRFYYLLSRADVLFCVSRSRLCGLFYLSFKFPIVNNKKARQRDNNKLMEHESN